MNLPEKNLDTPFNITRSSHVVLTVNDLEKSRLFYTEVVGLVVTEETGGTLYLRGVEEACHHSLVLKLSKDAPRCERIGMRVLRDRDLEPLKAFFDGQGLKTAWADVPHQGKTLQVSDISGVPLEFCASMTVVPRPLTQFHLHKGGSAMRLDHYQILVPDVGKACAFYMAAGFWLTEYLSPGNSGELAGVFLARKGNPHDIVFFKEAGPAPAPRRVRGAGDLPHHARLRLRRRARLRQERRTRPRTARAGACALCVSARPGRTPRRDLQHPLPGDGPRSAAGALGPEPTPSASIRGACRRKRNGTRRRRRSRTSA